LRNLQPGTGGELQLTDGIAALLKQEAVLSYQFEGTRYDCGSKQGYLQATVQFALKHPEVKEEFSEFLRNMAFDDKLQEHAVVSPTVTSASHTVIYM
jgi:UTP--glucose-1-phosphate uridylyltransferase